MRRLIKLKRPAISGRAPTINYLHSLLMVHGYEASPSDIEQAWEMFSREHEGVDWADHTTCYGDFYVKDQVAIAVQVGRFIEKYFEEYE